jgi:hypothetical protein
MAAGYQFAHIQTYSSKGNKVNRSFSDVLLENSRIQGHCHHVKNPEKVKVLYGSDPADLILHIEQRIKDAKAQLRGTGKRIQSNTHCMEGAVFSYPISPDDLRKASKTEQDEYRLWVKNVMRFAKEDAKRRGLEVLSIVQHSDEAYMHLHQISVPIVNESNKRFDAKLCHDGHNAARKAKDQGLDSKQQMKAYRDAMSAWQDDLHAKVGSISGHTRTGPGRARLTRDEWNAQKGKQTELAKLKREMQGLELKRDEQLLKQQQQQEMIEVLTQENASIINQRELLQVELRETQEHSQQKLDKLSQQIIGLKAENRDLQASSQVKINDVKHQLMQKIETLESEIDEYRPTHRPRI